MSKRSEVWNYFKRNDKNRDFAFCKQCNKQLGCKGSSTTPLLNHLKLHKIYLNSSNLSTTTSSIELNSQQNEPISKKKRQCVDNGIIRFLETRTLDEILSRCVAEDGFSMSSIVKSQAINGYVRSKGFDMPKCPTTVTKCILNYYQMKKNETINIIKEMKKNNVKFSITMDEWTDNSMHRYLNISLHALIDDIAKNFEVFVLGLIDIKGTCDAEQTKLHVTNKLTEFKIDIKRDIISSTHDAAAVMVKYGRISGIISQLCFNHGLHLAITDVLYKKHKSKFCDEDQDITNYDEEQIEVEPFENINNIMNIFDDANIICKYEETDEIVEFTEDYQEIIAELRKIVRIFKSSSVKNSILQRYVYEQEGKTLQLMLDIKIRWNSLITMIERFLQIKGPVNKTLHELGQQKFSEKNISILKKLFDVLSPIESAVKELSKNSATLLTAEGCYKFIFDKLDEFDTNLSTQLSKQIKKRMDERRDKTLMTLIIFLETGTIPHSNKYFEYTSKGVAIALAVEIFERIHTSADDNNTIQHDAVGKSELIDEVDESKITEGICKNSLQRQLEDAISSISYIEDENKTISTLMKKDFSILSNTKTRTSNLNILFNALLTITPTSAAAERVFSIAGLTKTKIRSRLNLETLNAIIFLKNVFLKMK